MAALLVLISSLIRGGGWEDELKNKTNLSQRLVEVEAELGNRLKICQVQACNLCLTQLVSPSAKLVMDVKKI